MSTPSWNIRGQYYETCNCDFVCPCVPGQMTVRPTHGSCTFVMALQIESGSYGSLALDGLGFAVVGVTPEAMANGNWSVALITDERASSEQRDAITAIASGAAGGPMAAMSGLIGKFLGVAPAPFVFDRQGMSWSVQASPALDMAAEGAKGLNPDATEPLYLENTGHPAADRFALAHATRSHVDVLGLAWHDASGKNNGQYAPFAWRSA